MDEIPTSTKDGEVPESAAPLSHWKQWSSGALALIVLVTIGIALFWWFQSPSYGVISTAQEENTDSEARTKGKKEYSGKSVTFFYPAHFIEKPTDGETKFPQIERLMLSSEGLDGKKLTLLVQDNTGYKFEEFSSYRIRDLDKKTYTQETIKKNGLDITLFTKSTTVYEVGAFFQNGPLVASLVMSSPIGLTGLREELLQVLETIKLKNSF